MTAPALPEDVEREINAVVKEAGMAYTGHVNALPNALLDLRTAIRAAMDKRGEVSPAAGASARALGGDGEPVLTDWDRRLAEFDDDPRLAPAASEVRRVRALWANEPSADRTKCMDRAIAGAVLRFVDSTRPAATGDTTDDAALAALDVEPTHHTDRMVTTYTILGLDDVRAAHAEAVRVAVEAERGECEKACQGVIDALNKDVDCPLRVVHAYEVHGAEKCITAIRARGVAKPRTDGEAATRSGEGAKS